MAKILIASYDDRIVYWDRKVEIVFLPMPRDNKSMPGGKCFGCEAGRWMPCEEVKCGIGERKDKKDVVFYISSITKKPRVISFFENLKHKDDVFLEEISEVDTTHFVYVRD